MHVLELKVPPPLVAFCVALLMWLAAQAVPQFETPFRFDGSVALALASSGFGVSVLGLVEFWRAQTTINPHKPASTRFLVDRGIYRFTRNPMYLGIFLLLLAWAVFLSNAAAFILAPLFVLYINRFQIIPEERVLSSMFGMEFTAYMAKVRRWL